MPDASVALVRHALEALPIACLGTSLVAAAIRCDVSLTGGAVAAAIFGSVVVEGNK